jgi:hypothetical protein
MVSIEYFEKLRKKFKTSVFHYYGFNQNTPELSEFNFFIHQLASVFVVLEDKQEAIRKGFIHYFKTQPFNLSVSILSKGYEEIFGKTDLDMFLSIIDKSSHQLFEPATFNQLDIFQINISFLLKNGFNADNIKIISHLIENNEQFSHFPNFYIISEKDSYILVGVDNTSLNAQEKVKTLFSLLFTGQYKESNIQEHDFLILGTIIDKILLDYSVTSKNEVHNTVKI